MTQVKCAQPNRQQVALRPAREPRTLAQARADFEAQMRAMAVSDLQAVSSRLKALRAELEAKEGDWNDIDLANAMKIAPRTFQSWQNGEVENRDGKGYEKMARWYSRRLGRKITKRWIVFGDEVAVASKSNGNGNGNGAAPIVPSGEGPADQILALVTTLGQELAALRADVQSLERKLLDKLEELDGQ